jgi:DNA adenine methylase
MKYLGGKQRLGRHIAPILKTIVKKNPKYKSYIEPFCGALGVLRNMTDIKIPIYASDYHPDLIALFQSIQQNNIQLPDFITEDEYLHYKHNIKSPNAMKGFAGFGSSFGGRFFAAFAQKYLNGKKENFCLEAKRSLLRLQPTIQSVHFSCIDYRDIKPKKAIIYCDPPYQYTKFPIKYRREVKKYDTFDNNEFWSYMREWSKNNIVIVSETDAPSDFVSFWDKEKTRSICQSQKTRYKNTSQPKKVSERLFIHKNNVSLI